MPKKITNPNAITIDANERFSYLSKLSQDVVWDWDLVDQKIWWSDGLMEIYGYPNDQSSSLSDFWYHCIHPEDQGRVREKLQSEWSNGATSWTDHYKFVKSDGTALDVNNRGYIIYNEKVPVRMIGSIQYPYPSTGYGELKTNNDRLEKLQFAVSSAEIGIWELNPVTNQISWDKKCTELFGYAAYDEVDYSGSLMRVHRDDRQRIDEAIKKALDFESGGTYDAQFRTINNSGQFSRWIQCRGQVTFNTDHSAASFIGIAQDITPQVANLEKILLANNQASLAIESAAAGSFLVDLEDGQFTYSAVLSRILTGNDRTDLSREQIMDHLHPDDMPTRDNAFQMASESGDLSYEARYVWDDGSVHWVRISGKYLYDRVGKKVKLSGIVQDITDQVNYQSRLKSNEEYLRNMIDNSPIAIALLKEPCCYIEAANNAFLALVKKDLEQKEDGTVIRDENHPFRIAALKAFGKEKPTHIHEMSFSLNDHDESQAFYDVTFSPVIDDNGSITCVIATGTDITMQVQARKDLAVSEKRFRALIEEAPIATTLLIGKDLIIEHPNDEMLQLWGKGDVRGLPLREVNTHTGILSILAEVFETGTTFRSEETAIEAGDNVSPVTLYYDITYKPLKDSNGKIYAILEMAVDVTSQIAARKELSNSEERYRLLASELDVRIQDRTNELRKINQELTNSNSNLQQFAYAASHDLQEPLRKIQSFGSRLQASYGSQLDATATYILDRMQDASKRMSAMIDDLLAYSRLSTQDNVFGPVSLDRIVQLVIADLEIAVNENNATIATSPLPVLLGNERQLIQLFLNIVGNALKYSKKDVPTKIQINSRTPDVQELKDIPGLLADEQYTCIEVSDNGIGFNVEYLDRIFQMFQRLHGRSEYSGSGIGLALCKKVIQNHHGFITAQSEPNVGSTFQMYLPVWKP